jgi:hypothetical protein
MTSIADLETERASHAAPGGTLDAALAPLPATGEEQMRKQRILEFEAPYLEDKLLRSGVVTTKAAAAELFLELKKYLFVASTQTVRMPMISALVDSAWHQFILYTVEYEAFCRETLGRYQHHSPRAAPTEEDARAEDDDGVTAATFIYAYRSHFGGLPDLWHNDRCLRPDTRLMRADLRHELLVDVESDSRRAVLKRRHKTTEIVCRVSLRARGALEFIAAQRMFLVRELVGVRDDSERLALLRPLVEIDVLNIAP